MRVTSESPELQRGARPWRIPEKQTENVDLNPGTSQLLAISSCAYFQLGHKIDTPPCDTYNWRWSTRRRNDDPRHDRTSRHRTRRGRRSADVINYRDVGRDAASRRQRGAFPQSGDAIRQWRGARRTCHCRASRPTRRPSILAPHSEARRMARRRAAYVTPLKRTANTD